MRTRTDIAELVERTYGAGAGLLGSVPPAVAKVPAGVVPRLRKAPVHVSAETKSLWLEAKSLKARAARERGEWITLAVILATRWPSGALV